MTWQDAREIAVRNNVEFCEQDRAEAIWLRAVALTAFGDPHPLGASSRLPACILMTYLLHAAGLPRWLIEHYRRADAWQIRSELLVADLAREDAQTAAWLDQLAAQMPFWHQAELSASEET